jgi:hypothetical protein
MSLFSSAHAIRADATAHATFAVGYAVPAIIEPGGHAAIAEGRALQRTGGDQAVATVLVVLGAGDGIDLRFAVRGVGNRACLQGEVLKGGTAVRTRTGAETVRRHAVLLAVLAAEHHVQPVVQKSAAPGHLQRGVLVVVVGGLAAFDVSLQASELLVRDEVDDAADRVRTIRGGGAAGVHVDTLDQQLRELADVGHAGDVGRHHALAVEQRQRAERAQAAQAERAQALHAARGAVGQHRAARASLQRGQFGDRVEDVRLGRLLDVFGCQRGGGRGLVEAARRDARAGHGDDVVAGFRSGLGFLCAHARGADQAGAEQGGGTEFHSEWTCRRRRDAVAGTSGHRVSVIGLSQFATA